MENRFVFMWAFAPRIFKNHVWACLVLPIRLTISYGVRTSSGFLARVSIKAPHGSAVQEFVWVPESDVLLLASLGLIPSPLRHGSFPSFARSVCFLPFPAVDLYGDDPL